MSAPTGHGAVSTPEPGTPVLTVFRNRLRPDHLDEYHATLTRMQELVRAMPGFLDSKTFTAEDGERVTVVTFADAESERAWRDHPEHREAQRLGAELFYSTYSVQVGHALYSHTWTRPDAE